MPLITRKVVAEPLSQVLRPVLPLAALPDSSLRRLSRPHGAAPSPCSGVLRRGCWARSQSRRQGVAASGGARVLQGGALLSARAKCLLEFLSAPLTPTRDPIRG